MPLCTLFLQCTATASAVHCIRPCSALREKSSVFVPSRSLAFIFFSFDIYLIKVPVFLPF